MLHRILYELTGNEAVTKVCDLPSPALPSEPILLAEEHLAVLGYRIAMSDLAWHPTDKTIHPGEMEDAFAILRIKRPAFTIWTPYSQEGIGKHPLARVGLSWFSVFEVANSPLADPHPVLKRRHLIFQFEDSTLNIVCEQIEPFPFGGIRELLAIKVATVFAGGTI